VVSKNAFPIILQPQENMKRAALQSKWATQASKRQVTKPARGPALKPQAFFKPRDVELKFKDTSKGATSVAVAGTILDDSLVEIAEGNTDSQRSGNKITVKSVMLRGRALLPGATQANDNTNTWRVIIYLDKQANGATAATTDILAGTPDAFSFNNLDNSDRFRTLAEETITLSNEGAAASGAAWIANSSEKYFFMKAKLNMSVKYSGTNGVIGDIRSANIGVMAISMNTVGTIQYTARVKFTDN